MARITGRLKAAGNPSGFSLPELVVVLGIIVFTAGIILAAVGNAKQRATAVRCAANLRSVGQFIAAFAESHDDRPSPTVWQRDTHWGRGPQIGWDLATGLWAKEDGGIGSIWRCPQQLTPFVGNARALGTDRRELGSAEPDTTVRSHWQSTARLALAYDLQNNVLDRIYAHALDPSAADLSDEYYPWPLAEPYTVGLHLPRWGPHRDRYAVLFADGHSDVGHFEARDALLWTGQPWWPDWFMQSPISAGRTD